MSGSSIAVEIIYLVTSQGDTAPVRVKELYLTLDYSEARVSEVLRELVATGWLISARHPTDGRMKCVYPSAATLGLMGSLQIDM